MAPPDDDAAWREIVDNYGDRPAVPPDVVAATPGTFGDEPAAAEPLNETFVPPPLAPPPEIAPDRRLAWVGLVTAPLLFVVTSLLAYPLPGAVTGLLVLVFFVAFGYLVATMSREPRDPDDDGARL